MAVLKSLQKALKEAEDNLTRDQAVYHKAQDQKKKADAAARKANVAASNSANEVAALKKSVAELEKRAAAEKVAKEEEAAA